MESDQIKISNVIKIVFKYLDTTIFNPNFEKMVDLCSPDFKKCTILNGELIEKKGSEAHATMMERYYQNVTSIKNPVFKVRLCDDPSIASPSTVFNIV